MKKIFLFVVIAAAITSCNSDDNKKAKSKDPDGYEKTKETLGEKEQKSPARFLEIDEKDRKNFFGQTVVKATITNNATVASFKDVELTLEFYSKTHVRLTEERETIFETIAPGKSIKFKSKYFAPKGTDSVAIKVLGAKSELNK
jgi:hypothetical protein